MGGEYLKMIDIFGFQYKFNFEKYGTFNTKFGGVLTILTVFAVIGAFVYFSMDYFQWKSPLLFKNSEILEKHPFFQVNSSNFFFAYRISDINVTTVTDPRYFEAVFEWEIQKLNKKDGGLEKPEHFIEYPSQCKKEKVTRLEPATFDSLNIQNYFCMTRNYSFGGDLEEEKIELTNFMFRKCNQETE